MWLAAVIFQHSLSSQVQLMLWVVKWRNRVETVHRSKWQKSMFYLLSWNNKLCLKRQLILKKGTEHLRSWVRPRSNSPCHQPQSQGSLDLTENVPSVRFQDCVLLFPGCFPNWRSNLGTSISESTFNCRLGKWEGELSPCHTSVKTWVWIFKHTKNQVW